MMTLTVAGESSSIYYCVCIDLCTIMCVHVRSVCVCGMCVCVPEALVLRVCVYCVADPDVYYYSVLKCGK
jgi:hypothetical protein